MANLYGRDTGVNLLNQGNQQAIPGYGQNPYMFAKSGQQTAPYRDPNGPVGNAAYDAYLNSPEQIQYRSTFWGDPALESNYLNQLNAVRTGNAAFGSTGGFGGGGGGGTTPPISNINNPPVPPPPVVINAPDTGTAADGTAVPTGARAGTGAADDSWMTENAFKQVYNMTAPALWDQYERSVENPLINRFAGSGSLGSAVGGLSGAAGDALQNARNTAGNSIAAQAYQLSQAPLMQQMTGDQQAAQAQYQGGLQALLAQYAAQANAASQEATMPYQATISQLEFPYQIFPGLLGGSMPQTVTTGGSSGGKK